MSAAAVLASAVTALFVPGDRPDRYGKAAASGADLVIIDLEDAVAPPAKDGARRAVLTALRSGSLRAVVRVNAPGTPAWEEDLRALAALAAHPEHDDSAGAHLLGVLVPKAAEPERLAEAVDRLGHPVLALLESAAGVGRARALAEVPGVVRLAFGALDFALDVGADVDALTGQVARAEVVIASRAAGLAGPLESPSIELVDVEQVETTSRAARRLGFTGRLCIHPAQLDAVRSGFAPSAAEIGWARQIVRAGEGVERVGDQMVDRPVLERARRILGRAGESG